jgi:hypothetical protein
VLAHGRPDEVVSLPEVVTAYLGETYADPDIDLRETEEVLS